MQNFTLSDLGRVHWGSTLTLAAGRGFFSGLVIVVVLLVGSGVPGTPSVSLLALPVIWGLIAPFFGLFIYVFLSLFGWLPFTGLLQKISSLAMCLGDPIVYMVNRAYPGAFNVADLQFFNFLPIIFITYPD